MMDSKKLKHIQDIKELELQITEIITNSIQYAKSFNEVVFLESHLKLFEKEFELYLFEYENDLESSEVHSFNRISKHVKSFTQDHKKFSKSSQFLGASANEDSGGVRR